MGSCSMLCVWTPRLCSFERLIKPIGITAEMAGSGSILQLPLGKLLVGKTAKHGGGADCVKSVWPGSKENWSMLIEKEYSIGLTEITMDQKIDDTD